MKECGKLAGGNPVKGRAENDFYATNQDSIKALLEVEEIIYPVWEPACGEGHISKYLTGGEVYSTDLIYRGFGKGDIDFLKEPCISGIYATIITNPPFNLFQEFVERALELAEKKVIMFGKLQALEGQKRATFIQKTPLKYVYVFKKRQKPLRNGKGFNENGEKWSSTMAFSWYIWEKGYKGEPIIRWI